MPGSREGFYSQPEKNREHQEYFWNVIVLQEKNQSGVRKLKRRKRDQFVVLWLVRVS